MRKLLLLGLLLLVMVVPVQAQDAETEYRLKEPDVVEYLEAVPEVIDRDGSQIYYTVRHELDDLGDLGDAPFDALYGAYQALDPVGTFEENLNQWPEWIVFAWIRDNNIDLSGIEQIAFEDYVIEITPTDFNSDGQDEWIFDIVSEIYNGFWIVAEDSSTSSGYRRVETSPMSMSFSINCPAQLGCGGTGEILGVQDVNIDGLPELLVSRGSCGYGICGVSLDILAWRDDIMIDLAESTFDEIPFWEMASGGGGAPAAPPDGTWTFRNIDDDSALELVESDVIDGSMDCTFQRTRIFDWNAEEDRYIPVKEAFEYENSGGCSLRLAHLALMNSEYVTAVQEYERALNLLPTDTNDELLQYARLRLASAYTLSGQETWAVALLEALVEETPATTLMETMIDSAYEAYYESRNSVALCASMYQSIRDYDFWSGESQLLQFGQINDYSIPINYGGGDFSPSNTGCNLPALIMQHAVLLEVDNQTPVEKLQEMGWQVTHTFQADLNNDGMDERLIWTASLERQTLLLVSSESNYQSSIVYLEPPSDETVIDVHRVSDDLQFLVRLSKEPDGYCPDPEQARNMTIYKIEDLLLSSMGTYVICEDLQLDMIFSDSQTFSAWVFPSDQGCMHDAYTRVTFSWNEVDQQFIQDVPLSCPEDQVSDESRLFACGVKEEFCGFYLEGQDALKVIDIALARPPEFVDAEFLLAVHYWRGLTLEALDRPDEALAEYVAIYEAAPESAWGMLAALHFEVVDG